MFFQNFSSVLNFPLVAFCSKVCTVKNETAKKYYMQYGSNELQVVFERAF